MLLSLSLQHFQQRPDSQEIYRATRRAQQKQTRIYFRLTITNTAADIKLLRNKHCEGLYGGYSCLVSLVFSQA